MEIYDFEIRRWTKEFDNIRKVLQTSANFVRWYTPTKRIFLDFIRTVVQQNNENLHRNKTG